MTLELRKQDGEFSAETKEAWKAFIANLADGCYLLPCFECGSAAGQIEALAAWYNGVGETEKEDPAFIHILSAKSDSLAFYIYRLSDEIGELFKEKEVAKLRREDGFLNVILRKRAECVGAKFVYAVAEKEAEVEIADLRNAEILTNAIYQKTKFILEAANNLQSRMSQRISSLRAFRDAVLRSDNSNQNFPT